MHQGIQSPPRVTEPRNHPSLYTLLHRARILDEETKVRRLEEQPCGHTGTRNKGDTSSLGGGTTGDGGGSTTSSLASRAGGGSDGTAGRVGGGAELGLDGAGSGIELGGDARLSGCKSVAGRGTKTLLVMLLSGTVLRTYAAELAADEADSAIEDAAEASEEVTLSAPEAALETALEAPLTTEVITEVTIPVALPVGAEALAAAEERMGRAAGVPVAVAATPAQRALAQLMAESACSVSQACWAQSRIP